MTSHQSCKAGWTTHSATDVITLFAGLNSNADYGGKFEQAGETGSSTATVSNRVDPGGTIAFKVMLRRGGKDDKTRSVQVCFLRLNIFHTQFTPPRTLWLPRDKFFSHALQD